MEKAEGRVIADAMSHQWSPACTACLVALQRPIGNMQKTFMDQERFLCLWQRVSGRAAEKAEGTSPSFSPPSG